MAAREWTGQTGGDSPSVVSNVKQAAGGAVESAKEAAGKLAGQVREEAKSRGDQQRENAASSLSTVADAVRRVGQQLQTPEQGTVARYTAQYGEALAGRIEHTGQYLREHNVSQMIDDVENFARRRPALFLGGAFMLGLAASRFLKSSRHDHEHRYAPAITEHNIPAPPPIKREEDWGNIPQSPAA